MKPSYVIGEPVTGDAFYGRREEIEEIVCGQGKAVHVLGMRRIGKTSLLLRVADRVPCLYLDFQAMVGQVSLFAYQVQYELNRQRKQHPWLPALIENGDAFACLAQATVEAEKAGTRLFLLCDEAEGLMDFDVSFLRRLRGLIWGRYPLRTVLASAKNLVGLDDLCREWHTSPFLNNFPPPLYLGGLSDKAADALITQSQSESPVKAAPELCAEIRRLTNNHPYLIQWLCHRLWHPDTSTMLSTGNTLRAITPRNLEPDEHLAARLRMDFDYLSDTERRILYEVCITEGITEPQLRERISHPRLSTFLHGLTQLSYLHCEGDDYAVGNTFFACWLRESADWKQKSGISDEAALDMMEGSKRMNEIKRLAALMRDRKAAGQPPYVLVLGAGATLSSGCRAMSAVVQAVVGHYDLKQFFEIMDNLSETERYARLQQFFQEPYPSPGYRRLAALIKDGYFDVILSTNFDFLLENAFSEVGLKAEDVEVLVNGRESEDYILKALERRTPRIKLLKLHGDLKARNMAFTPKEIFEFGQKVENVLARYLNDDVVIIGHEMRDDDINRCIRKDGGAIWYVHPEEPAVESFIWRAMQVRPSTTISGEPAQFDNFCEMLYKELTH
jgi:hypothetical protein